VADGFRTEGGCLTTDSQAYSPQLLANVGILFCDAAQNIQMAGVIENKTPCHPSGECESAFPHHRQPLQIEVGKHFSAYPEAS
jgi:hypothetical protein